MTVPMDTIQLLLDSIHNEIRATREENNADHNRIKNKLDKQNDRIRKLEVWRGWITGAIAVIGVVVGIIVKAVF